MAVSEIELRTSYLRLFQRVRHAFQRSSLSEPTATLLSEALITLLKENFDGIRDEGRRMGEALREFSRAFKELDPRTAKATVKNLLRIENPEIIMCLYLSGMFREYEYRDDNRTAWCLYKAEVSERFTNAKKAIANGAIVRRIKKTARSVIDLKPFRPAPVRQNTEASATPRAQVG